MTKEAFKGVIAIFYLATISLVITGLVFGFYYPDYDSELDLGSKFNHTVGGDAYNYIIMAGRGLIWIGMAIITAIIGGVLNIGYFIIGKVEVKNVNQISNENIQEVESKN